MIDKEFNNLKEYNKRRLLKYVLLKTFEKEKLGNDFNSCLRKGFSSSNPKIIYINYLRYYFSPFAFVNQISNNDLNLLAVQKKDMGLIYYSVYKMMIVLEEFHPREVSHGILKSIISLDQFSDNVREDINFFLKKGLLKRYQLDFINTILKKYDSYYKGFIGSYDIINEPYFHFKYKKL